MKSQIYSWKRFYCPRTGNISLSDGGYLSDPDSEFGHIYNPEVQPFEKISDSPCLVLLGEPGIGKSKAMLSEKTSLEATVQAQGDKLLSFDLREYGSEDRLVRDIFKCEDFISWKNGNSQLHLFLDSLDECRLRVSNVTPLLINKFRNLSRERLFIRIACRTFEWPQSFESELIELWGEKAVKVYELVPLRRSDVREAAQMKGLTQLLNVIMESLKRLEMKLQGENCEAQFLWDNFKKMYRPKNENAFSDYIKAHLDGDIATYGIKQIAENGACPIYQKKRLRSILITKQNDCPGVT